MADANPLTQTQIEVLARENSSFFIPGLNGILEGKTAIITGCSSGIGAATVKTFLAAGANVVGCYHEESDGKIYRVDAIDDVLRFAGPYPNQFVAHNLDIANDEGKDLISKYNIGFVPTLILSKDAGNYPALVQVWGQVGSVEGDGTFVFREIKAIKDSIYKDLTTNKITR